jgi:DNA-binding MarR family transcriptional regulator
LEGAGYIAVNKDFVGKKPRTRVALTRSGRKAFAQHIEFLRTILDAAASHHNDQEGTS